MIDKKDLYYTHALAGALHESLGQRERAVLVTRKEYEGIISDREAARINEAFSKFLTFESLLSESSTHRARRTKSWERFLQLEDSADGPRIGKTLTEIWDALKKFKRWVSGETSSSTRGGGIFAFAKSKAQKEEMQKLLKGAQSKYIKILNSTATRANTEYPNNEDYKEFVESTMEAIDAASEQIEADAKDAGDKDTFRAAGYKAVKQWISFQIDQKLGDAYKRKTGAEGSEEGENVEKAKASAKGAMADKKAKKTGEGGMGPTPNINKESRRRRGSFLFEAEEEETLATKKDQAASVKGLKNDLAPKILKIASGMGLGTGAVALLGSVIAQHWDDFLSLFGIEDKEQLTQAAGKVVETTKFDTQQVEEFVSKDVMVSDRFVKGSIDQMVQGSGAPALHSASDYLDWFKDQGNGNTVAGAEKVFKKLSVDNPEIAKNSDYILKRLQKGMSPEEAFKIGEKIKAGSKVAGSLDLIEPWDKPSGRMVSGMERMGGNKAIIVPVIVKVVTNKAVKTVVKTFVQGAGIKLKTFGLASTIAAAGLGPVAAAMIGTSMLGLYLGKRMQKANERGLINSRLAFFNSLYDDVNKLAEKAEDESPVPVPEPSPTPSPEPEPASEEEEDMEGCDEDDIKEKLLAALKKTKVSKKRHDAVATKLAKKFAAAIEGGADSEDLSAIVKKSYKKVSGATLSALVTAVDACVEEGMEDEEEGGGTSETPPGEVPGKVPENPEKKRKKNIDRNFDSADVKRITDNFINSNEKYKGRQKDIANLGKIVADVLNADQNLLVERKFIFREASPDTSRGGSINAGDTRKATEHDVYTGDPKSHPAFKKAVDTLKGEINNPAAWLPEGVGLEEFVTDFFSYLISKERLGAPSGPTPEEIEADRKRFMGTTSESRVLKGTIMVERWQRLAGISR